MLRFMISYNILPTGFHHKQGQSTPYVRAAFSILDVSLFEEAIKRVAKLIAKHRMRVDPTYTPHHVLKELL
jgi:hypothetical protein